MAKKRAHVDAVLTVTAASDLFTQDVEDFSDEEKAETTEPQSEKRPEAQSTPPKAKNVNTKQATSKAQTPTSAERTPASETPIGKPATKEHKDEFFQGDKSAFREKYNCEILQIDTRGYIYVPIGSYDVWKDTGKLDLSAWTTENEATKKSEKIVNGNAQPELAGVGAGTKPTVNDKEEDLF
ncbi:hypothetical protein LEP1GSC170_1225 [Leptospira interrogans serovar Bataviae str. HAI135]|nr:hypothetical protein LEP1GSC170_1225 [Leptospira interrogans serovar Bataviae str. HAI135]